MVVPTVNILKPRRFKVVFVNRITNCYPSYVTKARHLDRILTKQATRGTESKLLGTSDRERSKKQIVSNARAL